MTGITSVAMLSPARQVGGSLRCERAEDDRVAHYDRQVQTHIDTVLFIYNHRLLIV